MLVLGLDTTTRRGSCALARDGVVVREEGSDAFLAPASRLPAELMTLLKHTDIRLDDVDIYAVAIGPGSFTGLRVGIATMQGLAFAARKPLIGVSALDALADVALAPAGPVLVEPTMRVATWVDAWRGEVYAALYEGHREIEPPMVANPHALLASLEARGTIFIGDGAGTYRELIESRIGDSARLAEPVTPLLAGRIALRAEQAARAGHAPPPHAIRPLYVRRPDPELARDVRLTR